MNENIKGLLAKCWKDEPVNLAPGTHDVDEVLTVRISGTVERQADQMVACTCSLPTIPVIALFWEKCGVTRDKALAMLREAVLEAMADNANKGERIEARIKDVETAVQAVKEELIAKLPRTKRSGRIVTKHLVTEVLSVRQELVLPAA